MGVIGLGFGGKDEWVFYVMSVSIHYITDGVCFVLTENGRSPSIVKKRFVRPRN